MRYILNFTVMPLLAVALTVGSQSTLCQAASVFGLHLHHHYVESSPCVTSHDHSDHEQAPCSEDCESGLTEASNPGLLKTPQPSFHLISQPGEFLASPRSSEGVREGISTAHEPPGWMRDFVSPASTGCFLI